MPSGKYRVTINGFTCLNETIDDLLNRDGNNDEVYFKVNTKVVRGTDGEVILDSDAISKTMGDTYGRLNRVRAGTGSSIWYGSTGGIRSGDSFPSDRPWEQIVDPTGRDFPPYVIWEGELTQGSPDVVFVTPTIWEYDLGADPFTNLISWQIEVDAKYGKRAKEVFGGIWPVAMPVFDAVSLGIQTAATLTDDPFDLFAPAISRPIGLQISESGNTKTLSFTRLALPLTYEKAEFLINQNPNGKGNGVIGYIYRDDPRLRGEYQIWLQIAKIGGTDQGLMLQSDWRWCHKCQGLFFSGGQFAVGNCPAGGQHEKGVSGDYALAHNSPRFSGQPDWRWCHKCQGLFFSGGGVIAGNCPAGGQHEKGSWNYTLSHNSPSFPGQPDWRWCHKCQGLFFSGGGEVAGSCPSGGQHEKGVSGNYTLSHTPSAPRKVFHHFDFDPIR